MSDYTLSTEEVRREFAEQYASPEDHYPRFDRWLAEHDRQVRAEAWPCANYLAPWTCLTIPATDAARCDHCQQQATAVEQCLREQAAGGCRG